MKKRIQSLSFLAILAIATGMMMMSWSSTLNAQSSPPSNQQTQQPDQTPPPSQAPDSSSKQSSAADPSAPTTDVQTFTGTVVKSGDKYMLKDDSGKTYDIDHQNEVAKFDGKRVRVKGTLDASGTKIMVQ